MQGVNAVNLFRATFPKLEMEMGIGRVFLTDCSDDVALLHLRAWNYTLGDAVEMEIDKEQVVLSVRRIDDFETNMSRAENLIRWPGAMHRAICHSVDGCAEGGGEVDAVVEVPAISIDTRAEGRVHLVWRSSTLAEGPDEETSVPARKKTFFDERRLFSSLLIFHDGPPRRARSLSPCRSSLDT